MSSNERYHPRLEELHRANASRLRQIIAVFGWPGVTLVGEKGAQAAWRIALHSIAEPEFMRQCRDLHRRRLADSATRRAGSSPSSTTASASTKAGRSVMARSCATARRASSRIPLENESRINSMRMQAGLPPMAQTLAKARAQQPPAGDPAKKEAAELEFRRSVGWI